SDLSPEPIVVVTPVQTRSQQYSVLGQVQKPGVFGLERPTTLLDAVSRSGGIRSSQIGDRTVNLADLRRSVLLRGDKIIPVDFERLVEQGDMTQNVFLQPDDFVILPAKGGEKVYVLGNANRPGSVPYSSDLTLIKAIASAGGPAPSSYRTGLLLLRGATTPNPTVARVDLNNLLHGGGADFHLMPNDLVWIPKAPWQKLSQYARVALDSALTTIAIQQAQDSFGTGADSSGSAEVELGIASGPGGPEEP
ncbi:MAG: SLBB domain-containing protein, partial [Verrucomicrobiales bacterium]